MGKVSDFFREQRIALDGQQKLKMLSLDRQFEEMETQIQTLETKNLHLKAEMNPLQRQVDQLRGQIDREKAAASARDEELDEKAANLLEAIANRRTGSAAIAGFTPAELALYVNRLKSRGFIRDIFSYTGEGGLRASPEGLEYLRKIGRI